MITNQVLGKVIEDIKEIAGIDCSIWNAKGTCLVHTSEWNADITAGIRGFLSEGTEAKEEKGISYFCVQHEEEPVYVLALQSAGQDVGIVGRLGVSQLENLLLAYKKRTDKNHFFQNLLLDNMLLVDILTQAKKLGIENEQRRIVFLIEPKNEDDNLVVATSRQSRLLPVRSAALLPVRMTDARAWRSVSMSPAWASPT